MFTSSCSSSDDQASIKNAFTSLCIFHFITRPVSLLTNVKRLDMGQTSNPSLAWKKDVFKTNDDDDDLFSE